MNTSLGYAKKTLTNSNVLLSGGGDKALSEFIGSLNWDSTNKKLQYKSASSTDFTDLITFGSNAFTSYSGYNIAFQNNAGTTIDTFKALTSPSKTLKAGTNVQMTAASNVITITATDTWNANAVGVAGYVAAPTKANNANMTWQTDAEGVPAWRASNNHNHNHITSLGNKNASDLSSTYPSGLSVAGIYENGYPFMYGSTITANGNGGHFQIAGQWNNAVSSLTDYDYKTEMYIRGRRDSYDVWTTWTRVLTNRNWSSVITLPTVNNGTLSLQASGTTKTTFTANQSGNSTFNIATGSGNGTISAGGTDVAVKGLGSAAYLTNTDFIRAYGTSNANIDDDWGQSVKTFDPVPSGTPPERNPNITLLSLGNSFARRKMLAFPYSNDNIYYRRRRVETNTVSGQEFTAWVKILHSGNWSSYCAAASHNHNMNNIKWPGGNNLITSATANNQDWSIDCTPGTYTGTSWQVWRATTSGIDVSGTMLKVDCDTGKVSAPYGFVGNISGTATNADTVDNFHVDSSNGPTWGRLVPVKSDGVMEIGKYLDFHNSSNDEADYAVRLMCQGNDKVVVNLPTSAGILALTSQIPTKASWNYDDVYLKLSGGTMANTNKVTNLNAALLDGWSYDDFVPSGYVTSSTANLSSYWGCMWDVTMPDHQFLEYDITFLIQSSYNQLAGIVHCRLRQNGTGTSRDIKTKLNLIAGNIPFDRVRMYYNNSTGYCALWVNVVGQYRDFNASILKKTAERFGYESKNLGSFKGLNFSTVQDFPSGASYIELTAYTSNMSVSGNAASATKLQTTRTLWGQSFDGTGNVSGFMKNVSGLTYGNSNDTWSDGNNTHPWYGIDYRYCTDSSETGKAYTSIASYFGLYFKTGGSRFIFDGGNVGIGTTSPSYKLDVNGNIKATNLQITSINGVTVGNSPQFTDTTYSAGTLALYNTGTDTENRVWSASVLKSIGNLYLPLAGGTIASSNFGVFNIQRNHTTNAAAIGFKHYSTGTTVETMGYIGMHTKDGTLRRWNAAADTEYTILDSSNSSVSKNGETLTVKINGTTQSLTNTNTTYSAGTAELLSAGTDTTDRVWKAKIIKDEMKKYVSTSGNQTLNGILTIAPSHISAYQDALILYDSGDGGNEGARIRFTSASYTTGITLGPNSDKSNLMLNDAYALIHTGNISSYFKTINGNSIIGTGNIEVGGASGDYLPLAGGTLTGDLTFNNAQYIGWKNKAGTAQRICIGLNSSNDFLVGFTTAGSGYNTYLDGNSVQIRYGTSRSTGIYLNSSGNVGIGTTSPSYKLHVEGTGYYSGNLLVQSIDIGNTNEINATGSSKLWLQYRNSGALVLCHNGANCGVGVDNPAYKLDVNGDVRATNFYTTSDRNKKKNISEFSEHIRKFQLKDTEKWNYGVIAQEVEEMFREGKDGNMTVNYTSILSYYIGQLENKVKALEEKIRILETKQNKDV